MVPCMHIGSEKFCIGFHYCFNLIRYEIFSYNFNFALNITMHSIKEETNTLEKLIRELAVPPLILWFLPKKGETLFLVATTGVQEQ